MRHPAGADARPLPEHERIRQVYLHYDTDAGEQRKRDPANRGVQRNRDVRWAAMHRALASLNLPEGARILDVGCGDGADLARIATEFPALRPALHGIDLLPDRIKRASRALPAATLSVGSGDRLPYPGKHFDVILASTVFSSILDSGLASAVADEMTRVLADGGVILCYDLRYPSPGNPNVRPVGAAELRSLFPGADLRLHPVTLLPPLARRLGALTAAAYRPLYSVPVLRSHWLAVIRPRPAAAAGRTVFGMAAGRARKHATQVTLTLGGLGCERLITFAAVTLMLRMLPGQQGGAFVLMLRVAGFTGAFATLGLQTGAVRLISGAIGAGRERWADALLRTFFLSRLALAVMLAVGGLLASPWIAAHLFHNASVAPFVEWGCVSAASNAILMFTLHHLQARQSFGKYTVLTILTALTRIVAIGLLIAAGTLSASRAAMTWALLPIGLGVAGLFLAPRGFLARPPRKDARQARREMARLGRWLTVSSLIAVIFVNLDSLLVTRYLGLTAVDWYGAAVNLSLVVVMVATALFTVLLPAVSRLTGTSQIRRFYWRALAATSAGAILMLPAAAGAPLAIRLIYGARFLPATHALQLLYVGSLINVIYATVGVVFLALHKPVHVAGQAVVQVAASVPCYLVLIPRDGILGGAIGTLAGQAAALAYVMCVAPLVFRQAGSRAPGSQEASHAL